jgi:esterase/lipase superfamily enzyme
VDSVDADALYCFEKSPEQRIERHLEFERYAAGRSRQIRRVRFTLVIGEDDPFYADNVALSRAFTAKKIAHDLHVWVGNAHRFRYWRQMARIYT